MALHAMGLVEAAAAIHAGQTSARALVDDCLKRIAEYDPSIEAWTFLEPDYAREQADRLDAHRSAGKPTGPLHGVPIGIKDIIDTQGMPTECGSPLMSGRRPSRDAALVARLRAAGAVILGKTVTTEFAAFTPGKTKNPHDPARTPGGSSSGSAAAVASFMVPGAVGSQTAASVIRPASFCGVYGFKPSMGLIPRTGVLQQCPSLDHIGVFARSLEDAALLAETLTGHDPGDPATAPPFARPPLQRVLAEAPPVPPTLALIKTPVWEQADAAMRDGLGELAEALGDRVQEVTLPADFAAAYDQHRTIMAVDFARSFAKLYESGRDRMSDNFVAIIERGHKVSALDYQAALDAQSDLNNHLDEIFDAFDGLITPSAIGEAPQGLDATGDPIFGMPWTFTGVPALSLPLLQGEAGLPMGVQLVGQKGDDARLLRTARWLQEHVLEPDS